MAAPRFSVVVPACDEERVIGNCLAPLRRAARPWTEEAAEIVVVPNRCADGTERIAREAGGAHFRSHALPPYARYASASLPVWLRNGCAEWGKRFLPGA